MQPAYQPGDLLLVERVEDPDGNVKNRDHVVVDLTGRGEYAMKVYLRHVQMLGSINPHFDPIPWGPEMRLYGIVVGMFRSLV
ncbi:hypothetical protein HQ520_13690 [bacterium]|nr:hypothetical protein [bacterium]